MEIKPNPINQGIIQIKKVLLDGIYLKFKTTFIRKCLTKHFFFQITLQYFKISNHRISTFKFVTI